MTISIHSKTLQSALNTIKPATLSKTDLNAQNIKFEVVNSMLELTAYNYNNYITIALDADAANDHTTVVNHALLLSIVTKLTGNITIEVKPTHLLIKEGKSKFKVNTMSLDFILDPTDSTFEDGKERFSMQAAQGLNDIIKSVSSFASTEISKGILTAVNFQNGAIAATDSHRLIVARHPAFTIEQEISLPADFIQSLDFNSLGDNWTLSIRETFAVIESEDKRLRYASCRNTSGAYPAYNQLMPQKFEATIEDIEPKAFQLALDKAATVATQGLIKLRFEDGSLVFFSEGEVGSSDVFLAHESSLEQFNKVFAFTLKYLVAASKESVGDSMALKMNGVMQPVILTSEFEVNGEQGIMEILVMPCHSR